MTFMPRIQRTDGQMKVKNVFNVKLCTRTKQKPKNGHGGGKTQEKKK